MMPAYTTDTAAIRRALAAVAAPNANWHALVLQALDASLAHTGSLAAAIFTPGQSDGGASPVDLVALRGDSEPTDTWLRVAAASIPTVLSRRDTAVVPADSSPVPARYIILAPIPLRDGAFAVLALLSRDDDRLTAEEHRERALLAAATLTAADLRAAFESRGAELTRLAAAVDVVRTAADAERFKQAAIALCNTLATTLNCDRVTLGWVRAHQARVIAMSHTDKIVRRLPLLRDIESAMEEALDQDEEVSHPAAPDSRTINRAAEQLSSQHGPLNVLTLPLRKGPTDGASGGGASLVGALTLERSPDAPWTGPEAAALRLIADLAAPMLLHHKRDDAWLGAKAVVSLRRTVALALGPRHTIAKLVALVGTLALAALVFIRVDHTVPASFVFDAPHQRVIAAPFDAVLADAPLRAGDAIEADTTILARFDTSELRLEAAAVRAELAAQERQAASARRTGDATAAAIHDAMAQEAAARLALIDARINDSVITAPITGIILVGAPETLAGARLRQGDVLYRVAPAGGMLAEAMVPQRYAASLAVGQAVTLAPTAFPDRRVRAVIERIAPAAEDRQGQRFFRVTAALDEPAPWMRPGMEGEARLAVDRRSLLSSWTSDIVDWVRLRLWI